MEPAEIQTELSSDHEKVINKNKEVGQCAPIEAVINNEQPPEPAEMSAKDQQEFGENMRKWVADLASPERNKAKKLLKSYAWAFSVE